MVTEIIRFKPERWVYRPARADGQQCVDNNGTVVTIAIQSPDVHPNRQLTLSINSTQLFPFNTLLLATL
jgi:hypothetical protein